MHLTVLSGSVGKSDDAVQVTAIVRPPLRNFKEKSMYTSDRFEHFFETINRSVSERLNTEILNRDIAFCLNIILDSVGVSTKFLDLLKRSDRVIKKLYLHGSRQADQADE